MKYNILRRLRQHGFATQVLPATATAADALKHKPAGIFLSNGPGDPAALDYIVREVKTLVDTRHSDFWDLPGPPDSRPGVRRKDFQIEIRPSRRATSRSRIWNPARWKSPRKTTVLRWTPKSLPSDVAVDRINLERPDRRRFAAQDQAGFLRAISSGSLARPARFDAVVRGISRAD